jgi:single-stranded-DNA-specific exonuclease
MLEKQWRIAASAPPEYLRRFKGIHPIIAQFLINRGFDDPREAYNFLYAKDSTTFNPFNLTDMAKAIGRVRQAINSKEQIVVYGDFDADGVTATTLLVEALRAFNANVRPYIPHRIDEGYGLNGPALQSLADEGAKLIITVDCGIRSIEEIESGNAAGLDIIVTDHHSLGSELPDAYAVVNPKQGKYQESMLAGVGVAFKLVQALIMAEQKNNKRANGRVKFDIRNLLDLVAIGTVADLMPLNRIENRVLVRRGLQKLQEANRPGIRALLDVAGVKPHEVTSTTIGFVIGPRINAAGRLDDAMSAYNLLSAPNQSEAQKWASHLQELNTQRQSITRDAQEVIREQLEQSTSIDSPLIFASHESFQPGIVGLVAGRLTEEYFRPAIVMEQGETESRASCRSIPQFDITNALDQCAELLVRHGGHSVAAGFTVMNDNIPALRERLTDLAKSALDGQLLHPTLDIDMALDIHDLSEELVSQIDSLQPCGHGNQLPVFMSQNVHIAEYRTVGKDNRHLKLKISRASKPPLDAIGFGLGEWANNMPDRIDIAYQLEINEWNGRKNLQANLQDVHPTSID